MKSYGVTIQMKPLQQYFHMVLFIEYVVQTFESVDQILWCYRSNETSPTVLSNGTIYFQHFTRWNLEILLHFNFCPFLGVKGRALGMIINWLVIQHEDTLLESLYHAKYLFKSLNHKLKVNHNFFCLFRDNSEVKSPLWLV